MTTMEFGRGVVSVVGERTYDGRFAIRISREEVPMPPGTERPLRDPPHPDSDVVLVFPTEAQLAAVYSALTDPRVGTKRYTYQPREAVWEEKTEER